VFVFIQSSELEIKGLKLETKEPVIDQRCVGSSLPSVSRAFKFMLSVLLHLKQTVAMATKARKQYVVIAARPNLGTTLTGTEA